MTRYLPRLIIVALIALTLTSVRPYLVVLEAAVAKNDSGTAWVSLEGVTQADLTTFTVSAGSNLALVVGLASQSPAGAATVVWDSAGSAQSMTSLGSAVSPSSFTRVEMFCLPNPATGNLNLRATWTGSTAVKMWAIAFSGASQTTPCTDFVSASLTTATPSLVVTSTTDGATVVGIDNYFVNNNNSTDTQTEIFRSNSGTALAAASYGIGGTSNTHTWTLGGSQPAALAGVHVVAPSAAVAPKSLLTLGVGAQ